MLTNIKLLLLLVIPLAACATVTNPAFIEYKAAFYEGRDLPDTSIVFGIVSKAADSSLITVAECHPGVWPQKPMIIVNEQQWARFPEYVRRLIIYHEMGHCVLGLAHNKIGTMQPNVEDWR